MMTYLIGDRFRKRFAQLLDNPLCSRMPGDIEVEDLAAAMPDHKEAIDQLESDCRDREEIERRDHFAVILQESKPSLIRITPPTNLSKIPGHASFRNGKAEF